MKRSLLVVLCTLPVFCALALSVGHATPVAADVAVADDGNGPELRVVSVVHGMSFTLSQRESVPANQGPTTMVTRVVSVVPPGPPNDNGVVPPGPPQIELVVKVVAPDMEMAHAAGALAALGLMQGMTLEQIRGSFAQLNWNIQQVTSKGHIDTLIDPVKAAALAQLLISGIIAGDRPGGGCDAAIPLIRQGAAALGFAPSCPQ